jgi:hypothetical protein
MQHLIQSLESAIKSNNWYAALFIALALPDLCGYLENPKEGSQSRYENWFKRYILPKYSLRLGPKNELHIFLSASDCYALRCSFLHQGSDDISEQRARDMLNRFHFIEPKKGSLIHCNQVGDALQLQVDIFCQDIIDGAQNWIADSQRNDDINHRMNNILRIYGSS